MKKGAFKMPLFKKKNSLSLTFLIGANSSYVIDIKWWWNKAIKTLVITVNLCLFTFIFLSDVMYGDSCNDLFYYYGTKI